MPDRTNWDALALRWQKLEALEDRVAKKKEWLKESILEAVAAYGEIAPKAKTMRVLRGIAREIQATFPVETHVDTEAARLFLDVLPRAKRKQFFTVSEKFTLRPGAFELANRVLNARGREEFHRAVRCADGAPRVKVVKLKKQKKAA